MSRDGNFAVLILAAGLGTRMKSSLPKVLHPVGGLPMLCRVIKSVSFLKPGKIAVVTGQKAALVEERLKAHLEETPDLPAVEFYRQKLLKGSGRAVQEAFKTVKNFNKIMILCGDAPLFRPATLGRFVSFFRREKCDAAVLTADLDNPSGYGRIKRGIYGNVEAIVESSDADSAEQNIKEVNSGVYVFRAGALRDAIKDLKRKGPKREYYLTDSMENAFKRGRKVLAFKIEDWREMTGINSRKELALAGKIVNKRTNDALMSAGVTILDPDNTYIDETVKIGRDTVIYPGVHIRGGTIIGKNCKIGPAGLIDDCKISDNVEIKFACCIYSSRIRENSAIGPFSSVRPGSDIGPGAKIGNFSEVKKSRIGKKSKVPHLSYIGDTEMGSGVNIGAGTITCNYDGVNKYKTIIKNRVFVGSNTNLIAPVKIGEKAYIAAGSTITRNVPPHVLAIARAKQEIKTFKKKIFK
ncbi:MAG: bifunctional UDP-N-acetylglucosamine diphosphorylase/glucosamine-1-phosphate N-acetyltransferase GlmU [Elusimicrobia bacterium]|nr:bifunctional UDP-N-acetylglucosamine diphosphorylase/glucosamine-1-phosphate N-acetyltransferase GlmU [Elusimicrobiota bacterium]